MEQFEDDIIESGDLEEVTLDPSLAKATKKRVKRDNWYGPRFAGYMKLADIRHLIPRFKDFYYTRRAMDEASGVEVIVRLFDIEYCEPRGEMFFPSRQNLKKWIDKWDTDIKNHIAIGKAIFSKKDWSDPAATVRGLSANERAQIAARLNGGG